MPYDPAQDTYLEYYSPSGAITCRVLGQLGPMLFCQFRTVDWGPAYRDFGNYARIALFPEHLRPADPQSPGVVGFTQALAREVAPSSISPNVDSVLLHFVRPSEQHS